LSGAQNPQLGISRSGDPYLRKLFVQCAHHVLGHLWAGLGASAMGLGEDRWRQEGDTAGDRRGGQKIIRVASTTCWVTGELYKPFPKMV